MQGRDKVFLGTELKLNIHIEPMGNFTMDDYDWTVEVYCSIRKVLTIPKSSAIKIDSNNYVLLVDTEVLGPGDVKCKITAYIPDFDFQDKRRTEVSMIDTGIEIVKAL